MKASLVFRPNEDGSYPESSHEVWRGEPPVIGVNIPEKCKVLQLPDDIHVDKIHNYKLVGDKLIVNPPKPAPPSGRAWKDGVYVGEKSIEQKLIEYANELDTDSFTQAKQKLEHAQLTTDETKRAALIQEADTIYKGKT